eukprot:11310111-Ditylum_brightwellii.AAC.2
MPWFITESYNIGDNSLENNEEVHNLQYELSLTPAKEKFYAQMQKLNKVGLLAMDSAQDVSANAYGLVGTATCNCYKHTSEL